MSAGQRAAYRSSFQALTLRLMTEEVGYGEWDLLDPGHAVLAMVGTAPDLLERQARKQGVGGEVELLRDNLALLDSWLERWQLEGGTPDPPAER